MTYTYVHTLTKIDPYTFLRKQIPHQYHSTNPAHQIRVGTLCKACTTEFKGEGGWALFKKANKKGIITWYAPKTIIGWFEDCEATSRAVSFTEKTRIFVKDDELTKKEWMEIKVVDGSSVTLKPGESSETFTEAKVADVESAWWLPYTDKFAWGRVLSTMLPKNDIFPVQVTLVVDMPDPHFV